MLRSVLQIAELNNGEKQMEKLNQAKMLIDEPMNNVPNDWEQPDFDIGYGKHVREWKDSVDSQVTEIWQTFTDEQKQALAQNFNGIADAIADNEE